MFGKKKSMSPNEKKAKMSVLKDLHGQSSNLLSDSLKGLKKVTVASDSKKGLEKGLDTAEELIGGSKMEQDGDDADDRVHSGEERDEYMGDDAMESCNTPEEIDDLIKQLLEKKKSLQS